MAISDYYLIMSADLSFYESQLKLWKKNERKYMRNISTDNNTFA